MKGLRGRAGRLSWQLTMSYVAVTVIAVLTISVASTVRQLMQGNQQTSATPDQILEKQGAAGLAPYFAQPAPDPEALRYWIAIPLFDALNHPTGHVAVVAILDRTGTIMTSAACGRTDLTAASAQPCALAAAQKTTGFLALPQAQSAVHAALSNTAPSGPITGITSTGDGFLAMAIPGPGKAVVGVVMVEFVGPMRAPSFMPLGLGDVLAQFGTALPPDRLLIVLLASALGTCAGVFISRRLRARLARIVRAASAWSRGEFGVVVCDPARDEVGQLVLDLNRMAEQLGTLLAVRRELAVVEERQRLQGELHDAVKQQLFAAQMQLAATRTFFRSEPERAHQHLLEAEQLSGHAQQELSTLIHALRPMALATTPLAPALEELCRTWTQQTRISVELKIAETHPLAALIEDALFRVTQEALANIARHSGATRVWLSLHWEGDVLRLSIRDNGQGFDVMAVAGAGVGLQSMRDRVERVGGTLDIISTAAGTRVETRIAMSQHVGKEA